MHVSLGVPIPPSMLEKLFNWAINKWKNRVVFVELHGLAIDFGKRFSDFLTSDIMTKVLFSDLQRFEVLEFEIDGAIEDPVVVPPKASEESITVVKLRTLDVKNVANGVLEFFQQRVTMVLDDKIKATFEDETNGNVRKSWGFALSLCLRNCGKISLSEPDMLLDRALRYIQDEILSHESTNITRRTNKILIDMEQNRTDLRKFYQHRVTDEMQLLSILKGNLAASGKLMRGQKEDDGAEERR